MRSLSSACVIAPLACTTIGRAGRQRANAADLLERRRARRRGGWARGSGSLAKRDDDREKASAWGASDCGSAASAAGAGYPRVKARRTHGPRCGACLPPSCWLLLSPAAARCGSTRFAPGRRPSWVARGRRRSRPAGARGAGRRVSRRLPARVRGGAADGAAQADRLEPDHRVDPAQHRPGPHRRLRARRRSTAASRRPTSTALTRSGWCPTSSTGPARVEVVSPVGRGHRHDDAALMRPEKALDGAALRANAAAFAALGAPVAAVRQERRLRLGRAPARARAGRRGRLVRRGRRGRARRAAARRRRAPIRLLADVPAARLGRVLEPRRHPERLDPRVGRGGGGRGRAARRPHRAGRHPRRGRLERDPPADAPAFAAALAGAGHRGRALDAPQLGGAARQQLGGFMAARRAFAARRRAVVSTDVASTASARRGLASTGCGSASDCSARVGAPVDTRCALRLVAPMVRRFPPGESAGRATATYRCRRPRVVVLRCGYADGLPKAMEGSADILSIGMQYTPRLTQRGRPTCSRRRLRRLGSFGRASEDYSARTGGRFGFVMTTLDALARFDGTITRQGFVLSPDGSRERSRGRAEPRQRGRARRDAAAVSARGRGGQRLARRAAPWARAPATTCGSNGADSRSSPKRRTSFAPRPAGWAARTRA